ncbi:AMP-binding protein [Nocardioides mesophilus]|uniref:AMP-binding protein n=1 Tax=Nocardioides mesophilus TaxID=433659 RepID=UPI001CB6F555|nr:AMP-binding protein [Nocardioides mesophilus]
MVLGRHATGGFEERRPGSRHDLHPDLALLLTTSGSTGSPKLVRLSTENLAANADSIADYLGIRPDDLAATTLPLHYCYGLSVVNSHLAAGAALLLTERSVVDTCFWDDVRRHGVTTLAGVPYTFDLLDRVGFAGMDLPSLRYLTQAGGRLAPERVREYAALGRERGWDLFVMYGQTEATARMGYLPPDLADSAPGAIGVPVPGGSFSLAPLPETPLAAPGELEVGELVYEGPNVMLGYATTPEDLARGREVDALRTGDVARRRPDGLYEVIGRRNRFAKVYGLRIDLDQVERVFARAGHVVLCADGGDRLLLAVDVSAKPLPADGASALTRLAKRELGLPPRAVAVLPVDGVPRLPTGKPDYRSLVARGARRPAAAPAGGAAPAASPGAPRVEDLRAVYADVLGRPETTGDDSFVSLDGDSLSYVEMSVRLEGVLGTLPAGWHTMPVRELAATPPTTRRGRTLELNVLLRAAAIVAIVGTHANLFVLVGGAHVLLGVAGFNFGRFHLTGAPRRDRTRHLLTSVARIAVPSTIWLGLVALLTRDIGWRNVLLLNGLLGPRSWTEPEWWYWFIEVLVATLLVLTALMALPWVDRLERRHPFRLPLGLAVVGLLTRYDVVELLPGDEIHRASVVFWVFALGWATVRATGWRHRALVSALVVATVPGFFDDPARELVVVVGMLLLVWVRAVRVPAPIARLAGVLASASLYIYLTHWQVYPHLEDDHPFAATVLSLVVGVAVWALASRLTPYVERRLARR